MIDAARKGYKYILDNSTMGSGKSHSVTDTSYLMREREGEFNKHWYISNEHRTPSIEVIKDRYTDLMPRNEYGFKYDEDGKLIKAKKDDNDIVVKGNCGKAGLFHKLQELGYNPNDKEDGENPICKTCHLNKVCSHVEGNYRADRRKAFESDRIRADLAQLPREYNYSRDILTIEEAARELNPVRTIEATYQGLLVGVDRLRDILNPIAYGYLDALIQSIKPLYETKERYGLTTADILAKLPKFEYEDELIEAIEASSIDLTEVFRESDRIDGLSRAEKKKYSKVLDYAKYEMRKEAYLDSLSNLESLPPNALIWLLKAIRGDRGIALRIGAKKKDEKILKLLTLTIDDRWYSEIFKSAKAVNFLDATLDRDRLAYLLGVDPSEILVIREDIDKPLKNLTVNHIHIDGLKTSDLSDLAVKRVKAVMGALGDDIPAIAHKKLVEALSADGYWWVHNRGSNDYIGKEKLAFIGLPCPNKGAIEDEYRALTGGLDGFSEYYQSLIKAEILQGVGRQRCFRFPEREFEVYLLADLTPTKDGSEIDLSFLSEMGAKVISEHGAAIHPDAGSVHQVFKHNLLMAVRAIAEKGVKVTQTLLAKATGKDQSWVSKTLKEAGLTLTELIQLAQKSMTFPIDGLYRESHTFLDDPDYRRWIGIDPIQIVEEALDYIAAMGWKDYRDLVLNGGIYPDPVRDRVIGWLMTLMAIEPDFLADDGGGG